MSTERRIVTLDATGKRLGRLASEIATILNGKDTENYAPNRIPDVRVEVTHASRLLFTDAKKKGKRYDSYSGYFGGRKEITLEQLIAKKGYREVLNKAVYGMLPNNRLRPEKLKRLHVHE